MSKKPAKPTKADKKIKELLREYASFRKTESLKKKAGKSAAGNAPETAKAPTEIKQTSHAVEFFEFNTLLNSPLLGSYSDAGRDSSNRQGQIRRNVARRFRDITERSWVSPVKSPNYESTPSGSGTPKSASDVALDCIELLSKIKTNIPVRSFFLLNSVFVEDKYLWRESPSVLEEIRLALDFLAWQLSLHSDRDAKSIETIDPNPLFAKAEAMNSAAAKSPRRYAAESLSRINKVRKAKGSAAVQEFQATAASA
jgi:hypothetical protein